MGQKAKKPKLPGNLTFGKVARFSERPSDDGPIVWSFVIIDKGGPWCFAKARKSELETIYQKLREYSAITWVELDSNGDHHDQSLDTLNRDARKRLKDIQQDDAGTY